jgi:hypothetical protein
MYYASNMENKKLNVGDHEGKGKMMPGDNGVHTSISGREELPRTTFCALGERCDE